MTALRSQPRRLLDADLSAVRRLADAEPVSNCVLIARLGAARGLAPRRLGGVAWGSSPAERPAELGGCCVVGGSIVPIGNGEHLRSIAAALAAAVPGTQRSASSIVGESRAVEAFWTQLAPAWGPARTVRGVQPLLATADVPDLPADPAVRVVRRGELASYLPAAEAMFVEELGVRPGRSQRPYRDQLEQLIAGGGALARFAADGRVIFKAEIAAVTDRCTQIQGVWVDPAYRGRGLARTGMVSVLRHALRLAPVASLYVNDFNLAARALYRRMGMTRVGTMATVLL